MLYHIIPWYARSYCIRLHSIYSTVFHYFLLYWDNVYYIILDYVIPHMMVHHTILGLVALRPPHPGPACLRERAVCGGLIEAHLHHLRDDPGAVYPSSSVLLLE